MTNPTTTTAQPPRSLHAICEDARRGECDYCCAMPGEPCAWRGPGLDSYGYHVARFTWARAHDLISVLDVGAVLWTVAATSFTTLTVIYDDDPAGGGEVDDDGPQAAVSAEVRMVGEVRAVLAAFDWESGDRQLALEAIERIVAADEDDQEEEDDDTVTCSTCGASIGIFIDRTGWLHYRGNGTAASPVEIYDAGHEATFAVGPGGAR